MDTNTEKQSSLFAAMAQAQALCKGVEKASKNDHHRYKYASAEDVIDAATQAMTPAGLAIICTSWALSEKGNAVTTRYLLTHGEGGSMELGPFTITIHPDKGRPMDKAITTGLTYLQAYMLRGVLNIPRVEEGSERDANDDKMIHAWQSEKQKERAEREGAARKAHAEGLKKVNAKKKLLRENCEQFLKAAGTTRGAKQMLDLAVWAGEVDEWPARDVEAQAATLDEALAYLIEWQQMEEPDALAEAHKFATDLGYSQPVETAPGFE